MTNTTSLRTALARARCAIQAATEELERLDAASAAAAQLDRTLLSVDEAAAALSVSRSTLYRRINDGTIKSVRLEGRRLIPTAELLKLEEAAR